ncbi:glutaminyl-peptide cyclotransferase [Kutzneria viridogrisea]|uniref:Glutamine cyclotransferase n=2 Tax=Kutzneria TaxID=43356 RepID=W5VZE5_9PSEU|nr:glutaminyl-peptide cyclotransferase [Kutzneria albida]AHH93957.1 glutamine cyclotransferase precursor [Kutzneria albida DSM 43870]MBA8931038.1 glutaminyl-peptide cyclotransferase [Kutzneria viridogrisea]
MRTVVLAVAAVLLTSCAARSGTEVLRVEVLGSFPHDRAAFTEGYEVADGVLYESTGLAGQSSLRALDPATGRELRRVPLAPEDFGEGITVVGDRIWQLTWQQGVALEWDRNSLTQVGRASYQGEGWGLCHDGSRFVSSDGSDRLTFRDLRTFQPVGSTTVHWTGQLNELECVDGSVWANVWHSRSVLRIDPDTGQVLAVADLSALGPAGGSADEDVLNGIAALPGGEFLVTGKYWPDTYRVRFVRPGA